MLFPALLQSVLAFASKEFLEHVKLLKELQPGNTTHIVAVPAAEEYHQDALKIIKFSGAAYCNSTYALQVCQNCKKVATLQKLELQNVTSEDLSWFSGYDKKSNTIVMSFRGTHSQKNWQTNNMTRLVPFQAYQEKLGFVHEGWSNNTQLIISEFEPRIKALMNGTKDVNFLFSGHSAGAAYAVLTASHGLKKGGFLEKRFIPAYRVTVGAVAMPRVGNKDFANWVETIGLNALYRIVKGNDVVPLTPALPEYADTYGEMYIDPFASLTPQFCSQQKRESVIGTCSKRFTAAEMFAAGPDAMTSSHMEYLGTTVACV